MAKVQGRAGVITIVSEPEWECPVHGRLKEWHIILFCKPRPEFVGNRAYCWDCIEDIMRAAGLTEVPPVPVDEDADQPTDNGTA